MCETSGEGGIRQRTGFYSRRGIDRCGRHDAEGLEGADSLSRLESARTWLSCTERILRLGPSFRRNESVCALFFGARQNGEPLEERRASVSASKLSPGYSHPRPARCSVDHRSIGNERAL